MTETIMLKDLKKATESVDLTFLRIETGSVTIGMPDTHFYSKGPKQFAGWIELKHVRTFNALRILVPWRPGQLPRMKDMAKGERVWLVLASDIEQEYVFIHGLFLTKYVHTPSGTLIKDLKGIDIYNKLYNY